MKTQHLNNSNGMAELPLEPEEKDEGFIKIDFKRLWFRVLQYWYLVLASVVIGLAIAFFHNRYAERIYPVRASIIINGAIRTEASLLYDNPLVAGDRNSYNELYILRSYPLIQRVVDDLNLTVSLYREGEVRTTEVYAVPFDIKVVAANGHTRRYTFRLLDEQRFELQKLGAAASTFPLNDTIEYDGLRILIHRRPGQSLDSHIGVSFILQYTPSVHVAGSFIGRLGASWAERGAGVVNLSLHGPTPAKDLDFLNGLIRTYEQYD